VHFTQKFDCNCSGYQASNLSSYVRHIKRGTRLQFSVIGSQLKKQRIEINTQDA